MAELRACGLCGERDIPRGVEWLWWRGGHPIHPWCDTATWERITFMGRRKIRTMVRTLLRDGAL
jgi:hypothetical protein